MPQILNRLATFRSTSEVRIVTLHALPPMMDVRILVAEG